MDISFDTDRASMDVILRIADRAMGLRSRHDPFTKMDATMDVTAVHCNGCPLRLEALLNADDFTFAHDILGIRRHLDRDTGQLGDFFVPRLAQAASLPSEAE